MKYIWKILFSIFGFFMGNPIAAQQQRNIPRPSEPLDLSSTSNLLIFIVIPVIILILYFVFRKRIQKVRQEWIEKQKEEKENQK
ncbi:hypothetical protein [Cecembia lonarensis]|uniref:Adenylosuccinate synthetase n=1 Tax=Cecembia lonarensis (strain CCUG 58316 / KCTC 22772 / LW9) TaxID=1225176 RepID=K1L255_CECL9|nr:hypothetical protein [Cecembia lonarensis]EKB48841.1 hypothetical protein B879_02553 [Cecembia lonarensis LW9]